MGIISQAGWVHWLSRSLLMGGQIVEQCARRPASALQGAQTWHVRCLDADNVLDVLLGRRCGQRFEGACTGAVRWGSNCYVRTHRLSCPYKCRRKVEGVSGAACNPRMLSTSITQPPSFADDN